MTCTECSKDAPVRASRYWQESHTLELRSLGWFVWFRSSPVAYHGVVICPECRERDPEAEKRPAAPMEPRRVPEPCKRCTEELPCLMHFPVSRR